MKEKINPIGRNTGRNLRFLLCDTAGNFAEPSSSSEAWVSSPVQCLDKAVDWRPEVIVVRFGMMPVREREALVEMCTALKRNSHTRTYPVLAILHSKHRKLAEYLGQAKVDYIRYIGDVKLDSFQVREIIDSLEPADRLEKHLETVCPFLHYSKIDSQNEMTVCGAYLDRMVLGGYRLREICETENHLQCEYYLNPRPKS